MTKCPKYYECDMRTSGDYVNKSCEGIGFDKKTDRAKAKCLRLRLQWEKYRKSLPDWEEDE